MSEIFKLEDGATYVLRPTDANLPDEFIVRTIKRLNKQSSSKFIYISNQFKFERVENV